MEMIEQPYYQEFTEIPYDEQLDEAQYSELKRYIGITIAAGFVSALIYFFSDNKIFAGLPFVLIVGSLCLINTNFGFMVLFSVPVLEEWFVLVRGESLAGGLSLSKSIGIVIVVSYLLTRFGRRLRFSGPLKLMIVIIAWMVLSLAWSPYPLYSFIRSITYILYAGLVVIFFNTVEGANCLKLMLWSVFGGNVLIALLLAAGKGVHTAAVKVGFMGGYGIVAASDEEGRLAFAEGGAGANVIAIFLVFAVMLGFYFFLKSGWLFRIGVVLAELLLLFIIIKTESRSGLIYVVLIPLATYVLAARKGHILKAFLSAMLLLIVAAGLYYAVMKTDILPAKAKERMERTREDITLTGRTIIWQGGKYLFVQRPFLGWGWGTFPVKYGEGGVGLSAHSNIVMVAVELGIVGLILFGTLFFKLLFRCLKIPDYPSRWLCVMCLMWLFITGLLMTSMLTRVWWYLLAMVLKLTSLYAADFRNVGVIEEVEHINRAADEPIYSS